MKPHDGYSNPTLSQTSSTGSEWWIQHRSEPRGIVGEMVFCSRNHCVAGMSSQFVLEVCKGRLCCSSPSHRTLLINQLTFSKFLHGHFPKHLQRLMCNHVTFGASSGFPATADWNRNWHLIPEESVYRLGWAMIFSLSIWTEGVRLTMLEITGTNLSTLGHHTPVPRVAGAGWLLLSL